MSNWSQLSEDEIEDHLYVVGQRPIQFLLAGYADHGESFTVQFNHNQNHFLTLLLAAPADSQQLIFDCTGSPDINRQFLASESNVFVGRPDGIHVQFNTGRAREITYDGGQAFVVALPERVLRLQRREYFRTDVPRNRAPQCFTRLPGGGLLANVVVHDLSCGGLGLSVTHLPDAVAPGLVLPSVRLVLPEDNQDIHAEMVIRHVTELESRAGLRQWRLGLAFRQLSAMDENRIQRLIARIEHERRELV